MVALPAGLALLRRRRGAVRGCAGGRSRAATPPAAPLASPAAALLAALLASSAAPAAGVDGLLETRADVQEGRAGSESYDTRVWRHEGRFEERVDWAPLVSLALRYGVVRESWRSRIGAERSDFRTETQQPALTVGLRHGRLRLGGNAGGYRRDYDGSGQDARRDERLDYGAYAAWNSPRLRAHLRWADAASWRDDEATGAEQQTRESAFSAGVRGDLPPAGEFGYEYTENVHRGTTEGYRSEFRSHSLEQRGQARFAAGRGRAAWQARSRRTDQRLETGLAAGLAYLAPTDGGYLVDDSPEVLDPLEPGLTRLPALWDNDRSAPAGLDLGDDQPPGREYGGDYRNVQVDLGDVRPLSLARLYLDRLVLLPAFWRWRVFVTNDPEGRTWNELAPGAVTVAYREFDSRQRAWEFTFTAPVDARFLKLVDEKLGVTLPALLVTEFEVYGPAATTAARTTGFWRHRLESELTYAPHRNVSARYSLNLDERRYDDGGADLSGASHLVSARWARRNWSVNGVVEKHDLRSGQRRSTDLNSQAVTVGRGVGTRRMVALSWRRSSDHADGLDKTQDFWLLDVAWQLAPQLHLVQKVSHGRLDDRALAARSSSWIVTTDLRGQPRPNLSCDLRQVERWVDQPGSIGFTRFGDTQLLARWSARPLLSLESEIQHQRRERSDWVVRHALAWAPAPGGSLQLTLSAHDFHDTRADIRQRGVGGLLLWRPRPRLEIEGSVEKSRYVRRDERNWPLNTGFRVNWTF